MNKWRDHQESQQGSIDEVTHTHKGKTFCIRLNYGNGQVKVEELDTAQNKTSDDRGSAYWKTLVET